MSKMLIVIDMQNDFVTGSLANPDAQAIIPSIQKKIEEYKKNGDDIIFTRDTHTVSYLGSAEGQKLPVEHCIHGTKGWLVVDELNHPEYKHINKSTFGYPHWEYEEIPEEVELVGTCTDICVVSNAILIKTYFPNTKVVVDAACCAGTTPTNQTAALMTMRACQIDVIND